MFWARWIKRSRRPPLRALASTVLRSSAVSENSAATKTRVAEDEHRDGQHADDGDGDVHGGPVIRTAPRTPA